MTNECRSSNDEEIVWRASTFRFGHCFVLSHSSCFSKFSKKLDAIPFLLTKAFALSVLARVPREQPCEESVSFRELLSGTYQCFLETLSSRPHRRLQCNLL